MASRAEAAAYRRNQHDLVTLAQADLARFWEKLDHSNAKAVKAALEAFYPELVAAYGSAAASIAADHYDALRDAAAAPGRYRATVANVAPADQAKAIARWGIGPLYSATPDATAALALLGGATQRLVQQPARDTIMRNVRADRSRPRFARVPSGRACAWCLMLSSRGAVYWTAESAGAMSKYHSDCDCQPEPVWDGQKPSYDADALYDQYFAARQKAGSGDPEKILAQMREMYSIA